MGNSKMHTEHTVAFPLEKRLRKRSYVTRTLPVLHIKVGTHL